ncbi:MAG: tetratricopeptide repeat protein [Planctomycetaceae bacterium]|nr:tetratricopeptide repeat protein [Planctomycetaceae bacterium]
MLRSICRMTLILLGCFMVLPLTLGAQIRAVKGPFTKGSSSSVRINRGSSGLNHSGSSGYHHGHSHHGHHHASPGFRFTPYIGAYPGTGYYYGGYYSSYSRLYSPFGGSYFYGTYYPGSFGSFPYCSDPYGYGGFPTVSPLTYQVPRFEFPDPLAEQIQIADQFRRDAERRDRERPLPENIHHEVPLKPLKASTTQQRLRSQRLILEGDQLFRKQRYQEAIQVYRDANHAAPDVPAPYFRIAITHAVEKNYLSAVAFLKRTLELEPDWPRTGSGLQRIFGDDDVSRNALIVRVARWLEQDIRDPDRSLLMGVVLYDSDRGKAVSFLQTSAQLSGTSQYADPYLQSVSVSPPQDGEKSAVPPEPPTPMPETTVKNAPDLRTSSPNLGTAPSQTPSADFVPPRLEGPKRPSAEK